MNAGSVGEPACDVDVFLAGLRDRVGHAEVREDRIRRALAVTLADQRDDRHAHVERFERAVDAAERHRVEHEVDELVARLVLARRRAPAARSRGAPARCRLPRRCGHSASRNAGFVGENASCARGMRASTSRHRRRQRRDSLSAVTNAPIRIASAAMPSVARWNGCVARRRDVPERIDAAVHRQQRLDLERLILRRRRRSGRSA